VDALRVRARYAWLNGEAETAVMLMETARDQAGDAWDDDNEATLRRYHEGP
jgi:hypothetical protein